MDNSSVHVPVLLSEVLEALRPGPGGTFIDGTVNGGGHARALIDAGPARLTVLGLDRDPALIDELREVAAAQIAGGRLQLVHSSYAMLTEVAHAAGIFAADGILLDLGLSSNHFERSGRGFSFDRDEPLDLRFDPEDPAVEPAAALVRHAPAARLADIFTTYGEERYARRIARHIAEVRVRHPIDTAIALRDCTLAALPGPARRQGGRSVARVFQALRIAINAELAALECVLPQIPPLLRPGGRVAIIAFHSLEDRLVKQFFREAARTDILRRITKKPIRPSLTEARDNPRARSARLRVAERPEAA
jgi:16S rRNA (cytosine1402-N4)-methyltransferase